MFNARRLTLIALAMSCLSQVPCSPAQAQVIGLKVCGIAKEDALGGAVQAGDTFTFNIAANFNGGQRTVPDPSVTLYVDAPSAVKAVNGSGNFAYADGSGASLDAVFDARGFVGLDIHDNDANVVVNGNETAFNAARTTLTLNDSTGDVPLKGDVGDLQILPDELSNFEVGDATLAVYGPFGESDVINVNLDAIDVVQVGEPKIEFYPRVLDFGTFIPGTTSTRTFEIVNGGDDPVTIESIRPLDLEGGTSIGIFEADGTVFGGDVTVPPGGSVVLTAVATAGEQQGTFAAYLKLDFSTGEGGLFERHYELYGNVAADDIDSDGDGVPDALDPCPDSITAPTVYIGGISTEVDNRDLGDGCTLADEVVELVARAGEVAKNHGEFVELFGIGLYFLVEDGIISREEAGKLKSGAARTRFTFD